MDFSNQIQKIDTKTVTAKFYRKIILEIIREYLKKIDIKNDKGNPFSSRALFWYLKETDSKIYNKVNKLLLKIVSKCYLKEYKESVLEKLLKVILDTFDQEIDMSLFKAVISNYTIDIDSNRNSNLYSFTKDKRKHNILVSTIHKVKGETHTATLVLETYKDGYDVFQLLELLKGNKKKGFDAKKKLIYVAMTRPTHFLCLAVHKKHTHRKKVCEFTDMDKKLLEVKGFDVEIL